MSSISAKTEPVYGPNGYDERLLGYEMTRPVPADDVAQALLILEEANRPANMEIVVKELARMRMLTKSRARDDTDVTLMAAAYAEEMINYPPDVVVSACRKWTAMSTWWPSWAELKDLLEFRMRRRRAMLDALQRQVGSAV